MGERTRKLKAEKDGRLDKLLAEAFGDLSRVRIQAVIKEGLVIADGKPVTNPSAKIRAGAMLAMELPEAKPTHLQATPMDLSIVYEDDCLMVIDKPAGLVVHPAPGHASDTLVNALLAHDPKGWSGVGGVMRPGIVHRLDKDTSGLMIVAKTDPAHHHLAKQLASRSLSRIYQAVVWGTPPAKGTVEGNIGRHPIQRKKMALLKMGGKPAITHYALLERLGPLSLVECRLETGRTHQIRVHMSEIKHPLWADSLYGASHEKRLKKAFSKEFEYLSELCPRQALHATAISFIHPISGKVLKFTAGLPFDLKELLANLRKGAKTGI